MFDYKGDYIIEDVEIVAGQTMPGLFLSLFFDRRSLHLENVYLKPEYKGLNKIEVIEKTAKERFPRIAQEFGFKIESHNYFKYKGKFIAKIIFVK